MNITIWESGKTMRRDTRIPIEVTRHGKFTVSIYDMEAYQQNVKEYFGEQNNITHLQQKKPKKPYVPFPKRSYAWYGTRVNISPEKQGA